MRNYSYNIMFTGQVTGAMPSANKVIVAINTCKCHCQTSKSFIINICSCDKISRFLTEKSRFLAVNYVASFFSNAQIWMVFIIHCMLHWAQGVACSSRSNI